MGALCLVMACALMVSIGCKQDEGDGWISTLSGPKIDAIKDLTFTGVGAPVATYAQAENLVNDFLTYQTGSALSDEIEYAQYMAFDKAFKARYDGLDQYDWTLLQGKSYSYSVKIDDDTSLKTYPTGTTVTAGTINGSTKSSTSHSRLTPAEIKAADDAGIDYRQDGDKNTWSSSSNGTLSITGGFVQLTDWSDDPTFKVAGIVQIDTSNKGSSTLKDKIKDISTASGSDKNKIAVALLISDGTRAAKIRYSSSTGGGWKNRSSGWGGSNDTTDVEVWDLAGTTLLFTIPASRLDNRDAFRDGLLSD